ncbi:MAG: FKBP-type peptidyl-prolyl cis-trans isomerase [Chryseolinea sp.]
MNIVKKSFLLLIIVGLPIIFSACLDSPDIVDPNKQLQADITAIDTYLAAHSLTAIKDPNGLRMVIQELGTGLPANFNSKRVLVDYTGKLFSTGVTFDHNTQPFAVGLDSVIVGWQMAFRTLPSGSKATLYIPSYWGYGTDGRSPTIPSNAILTFDVDFKKVLSTTAESSKLGTDTVAIDNYLSSKSIPALKDTTGIRYLITAPGTGSLATWYSKLTVKFTYKSITDDTKVLASVDQAPTEFFYSRVVDYPNGLKVGLQKLGKGGKAKFYIPSGLAFGPSGAYSGNTKVIPDNANIIVEVEVTDITL